MFFRYLEKVFIRSQIFVAMMATALSLFFLLNFNILNYYKLAIISLLYFNGYLYTKFQNHKILFPKIIIFNFISFIISILFIYMYFSFDFLYIYLFIIGLGAFYNSRFLGVFIRKIPLVKIFHVGLCWAIINGWLLFETMNWSVFFITWCYITALIIPFDIRDQNRDNVLTLPIFLGISKSKAIAILLLLISNVFVFNTLNSNAFIAFQGAIIIASLFILYTQESHSFLYYSLGVESCVGLPLLFFVFLK